jgi:hypothetical protein
VAYAKKELIPPKLLYKYRPFTDPNHSVRRMLALNMWWFGSRRYFDDSEDFVFPGIRQKRRLGARDLERVRTDMQEVLDKTGVFCMSERADHPQLWSLYAADGAGLCVELESDHVTDPEYPEYGPFRVTYSDRPKALWEDSVTQEKRNRLANAALLQKSTLWTYQAEWRCIRTWPRHAEPTADRYYPIATRALVGVIFGWKLSEYERRQVIGWINGCYWRRAIRVRQATPVGERIKISEYLPSQSEDSLTHSSG